MKRFLRRWYYSLPRNDYTNKILWGRYFFRLARKITFWFLGLSIGLTLLFRFIPVPFTPLMFVRLGEQLFDSERDMRWRKDWVPMEQISPHLQLAVICAEDQQFLEHEGLDFKAIREAYKYNQTHKKTRGASTITQQTAKNLFLWPGRSWLRKGLEVYFTFLLEICWSKERIIEVYLNIIEYGNGIYGAEAAAQSFFKKKAADLNREESAATAAILPGPLIYNVHNLNRERREKKNWIIRQMRMWGGEIDWEDPNTPGKEK